MYAIGIGNVMLITIPSGLKPIPLDISIIFKDQDLSQLLSIVQSFPCHKFPLRKIQPQSSMDSQTNVFIYNDTNDQKVLWKPAIISTKFRTQYTIMGQFIQSTHYIIFIL